MKISVIIPTFNRAFTLPKTVDSILAQTHKDWDLTVIDDGSTDQTLKTIQPYLSGKIQYIWTPHRGTPHAWNLGAKISKHDYLFFTGDDVILDRDCLASLAEAAKKIDHGQISTLGALAPRLIYLADLGDSREQEADIEYAYLDRYTGDVKGSFNVDGERILEVSVIHGYSMIRKEAFLNVGGFDEKNYKGNYFREETDLWLRFKRMGFKLYYQPKAKIYCLRGLTKGGQWSNVRGSLPLYEYYVLRNHLVFLKKFYGRKAYFMFPPFIIRRFRTVLNQFMRRLLFE